MLSQVIDRLSFKLRVSMRLSNQEVIFSKKGAASGWAGSHWLDRFLECQKTSRF